MTPTGKAPVDVGLDGALLIWKNGQPWLGRFPDDPTCYLPVFRDLEPLMIFVVFMEIHDFEIKKVEDGTEFITSLWQQGVQCILEPRYEGDGAWRFELVTTAAALQPPS